MKQTALHFESKSYNTSSGPKVYPMSDDRRIELIIDELMKIYKREQERPIGHNDLPFGADEDLLEAIGCLEKAIEWPGEIEDSYGEPPITADEMHTAAWKEHVAMHS